MPRQRLDRGPAHPRAPRARVFARRWPRRSACRSARSFPRAVRNAPPLRRLPEAQTQDTPVSPARRRHAQRLLRHDQPRGLPPVPGPGDRHAAVGLHAGQSAAASSRAPARHLVAPSIRATRRRGRRSRWIRATASRVRPAAVSRAGPRLPHASHRRAARPPYPPRVQQFPAHPGRAGPATPYPSHPIRLPRMPGEPGSPPP